ncbi:hypothetical protein E2C01_066890 [Portunus trituberculatus]|uniref:Uncharacterized protein n=2 Tax=Portunus trituberculatus TaxID=210409 RepID=A0A5B7HV37_PORTR|nr:hypothetical protein [Portunus trituberculatus]
MPPSVRGRWISSR